MYACMYAYVYARAHTHTHTHTHAHTPPHTHPTCDIYRAVQCVYLGYPGSSGAPYIDYLVTDRLVSPPEMRTLYSEKLLLLPFTYQVNACY